MMQREASDSEDALGLYEDGPKQILLDPLDWFLPEQCGRCLVVHSWACVGSEFPGRSLFIDGDHPHVSPQDLHYVFLLDRTHGFLLWRSLCSSSNNSHCVNSLLPRHFPSFLAGLPPFMSLTFHVLLKNRICQIPFPQPCLRKLLPSSGIKVIAERLPLHLCEWLPCKIHA